MISSLVYSQLSVESGKIILKNTNSTIYCKKARTTLVIVSLSRDLQELFEFFKRPAALRYRLLFALFNSERVSYSGRLRPGSNSFIVFMYSFQKLWLKTSTRDVIC